MRDFLYITNDTWWDTDITILPDLGKTCTLKVFVASYIDPTRGKFPTKKLPDYIDLHNCHIESRFKDIRMVFLSIIYGINLLFASRKKIVIWVVDYNIYYTPLLTFFLSTKRTIVSMHNYIEHNDAGKIKNALQKKILRRFKYFHFFSSIQEKSYKNDYPQCLSFHTEMPLKDYGDVVNKPPLFDNNKRTYLFFGGIREYKRLDLFIEAINRLGDKANFIIAGSCSNWDTYESKIFNKQACACDIRFISNEDIPYYFKQSDFLILPYDDSTQSGPLLIAYNYNLPIIASSLPYFKMRIDDGITGRIFEKGDSEGLIKCIADTIQMSQEEYLSMKREMQNKVNQYQEHTNYVKDLECFIDNTMLNQK